MALIPCREDAGDASQGVYGSKVAEIHVSPQRCRGRCAAYVVFEGLAPGVYDSWYDSCTPYFPINAVCS